MRFAIHIPLDFIFQQQCTQNCIVFYVPHYFMVHSVHEIFAEHIIFWHSCILFLYNISDDKFLFLK